MVVTDIAKAFLLSLVLLVTSESVFADSDKNTKKNSNSESISGLEIILRPSYGSAGNKSPVTYTSANGASLFQVGSIFDGSATPYGGALVGEAAIGYRFTKLFSFGAMGGYRKSLISSTPSDGTANLARSAIFGGLYSRFYFQLPANFETYFSLGVNVMQDTQSYDYIVGQSADPARWTLTHYGLTIPVSLGFSYRVCDFFSVGPFFQVMPSVVTLANQKTEASGYATRTNWNVENSAVTQAGTYLMWTTGLDIRFTL